MVRANISGRFLGKLSPSLWSVTVPVDPQQSGHSVPGEGPAVLLLHDEGDFGEEGDLVLGVVDGEVVGQRDAVDLVSGRFHELL